MAYVAPATHVTGYKATADDYNGIVDACTPRAANDEGGGARSITSTVYATYTGAPSVTLTHGARVKVEWGGLLVTGASGQTILSPAISGANTVAASDNYRAMNGVSSTTISGAYSKVFTGLTPGSSTFALQAKRATANGEVHNTYIIVTPVG